MRFDFNAYGRDIASDLKRAQLFFHINHSFESGLDSFTELLAYRSETNLVRHPSYSFTSSELVLAADSYYNPFGPCGSPNRLPDDIIGGDVPCTGLAMTLDNYRYAELPRVIDNDGATYRVLQGLRGVAGDWDWESALSWSRAGKDDITHNRISNSLMQEALNDITAAAYNPFVAGAGSNLERALVDLYRKSETELVTFDVKLSKKEIFQLPAGPVGFDGNQEEKHTARLSWRKAQFGASLSGSRLGKFYQGSLTLEGGERYVIPTMETFHATLDYTARISGSDTRIRLGVNNFTNQRAPLADRYFGYFSNAHTDYGRYVYLDIRSSF